MNFFKIFFILFLTICCSTSFADENLIIDFFEGYVEIIDFNNDTTRFRIVSNKTVIDVYNSLHHRLDIDPFNLPKKFKILAPTTAIKLIEGRLPPNELKKYPVSYYQNINELNKKKYADKLNEKKYADIKNNISFKVMFLTKEQLDGIFSGNKETWKQIAKDTKSKNGSNVRVVDQGKDLTIYHEWIEGGYSTTIIFDENKHVEKFIYTMYYPSGSLDPEKRQFYQRSHNTKIKDVEPEYESLIKFNESNTRDYLEITTIRNKK